MFAWMQYDEGKRYVFRAGRWRGEINVYEPENGFAWAQWVLYFRGDAIESGSHRNPNMAKLECQEAYAQESRGMA